MQIPATRILVIDTETADLSGNVYDVGYTIADRDGKIYAEYNALVRETFTDADKMMGAFYARKLFSHYAPMLDAGEIRLTAWADICDRIAADCVLHGVNVIAAYNAAFDFRVMKQTHHALGFAGKVLPGSQQFQTLDIWRFACETKLSQKTYREIATANGWVSNAGNLRTGAEYAYRYCSGDHGFIEDHTALSDARIETAILAECYRQKRKVPYNIVGGMPWKIPNAVA